MAKTASFARKLDVSALESRIPGWGSDLDPRNRPAVPKEKRPPLGTGAHWIEPERQVSQVKIHKSPEHRSLTPVFGTSCPPSGLSGLIRDYAYRYSEGRTAHWMLLLFADRINVLEGRLEDVLRGRIFNPIQEAGLRSEIRRHGLRSRRGNRRADVTRYRNQALLLVGVGAVFWGAAKIMNRRAA